MKVFLLPTSMAKWFVLAFSIVLVFSCSSDTGNSNVETRIAAGDSANSVAAQHFSPEVMQALSTVKNRFEQGLRVGLEERSLGYAYLQHAIRMQLDFFEETQITNTYPFNGKFMLSEVKEAVEQLPFITDKCGFAVDKEDQVINFYCPTLDDNYFAYLGALPDPEGMINSFVTAYRAAKSTTPAFRKKMVLSSRESLDFDNWDHQLFYCLFQCWTNEEIQAYIKANSLQATDKQTEG